VTIPVRATNEHDGAAIADRVDAATTPATMSAPGDVLGERNAHPARRKRGRGDLSLRSAWSPSGRSPAARAARPTNMRRREPGQIRELRCCDGGSPGLPGLVLDLELRHPVEAAYGLPRSLGRQALHRRWRRRPWAAGLWLPLFPDRHEGSDSREQSAHRRHERRDALDDP
jgi:hypothetical protein